jgi:hypothetical protein
MGLSVRPLEGMKNLKYDVVKASPPVLILDNKIKCVTLVGFFFFRGNPTHKIVTGTTYTWELLRANHMDQSL